MKVGKFKKKSKKLEIEFEEIIENKVGILWERLFVEGEGGSKNKILEEWRRGDNFVIEICDIMLLLYVSVKFVLNYCCIAWWCC